MGMNNEEKAKFEQDTAEQETLQIGQKTEKESSSKTFSILSLCFGVLSLVTCGFFFVPEILGIVFAYCSKKDKKMGGIAKTGLICSIISIVLGIGFIILGIGSGTSENSGNTFTISETETIEDKEEISTTEAITEQQRTQAEPAVNEDESENIDYETPQETLYFSESGEMILFITVENVDKKNGTFTIVTRGEVLGELDDGYTTTETMKPVDGEKMTYISESGRFKITTSDLGLSLKVEDTSDSYLIDGDFVIYEEPKPEDQFFTLYPSELKNFARDENNIGTVISVDGGATIANMYDGYMILQVHIAPGEWIYLVAYENENDPNIYLYDDHINFVGTYLGVENGGGRMKIQLLKTELYNEWVDPY